MAGKLGGRPSNTVVLSLVLKVGRRLYYWLAVVTSRLCMAPAFVSSGFISGLGTVCRLLCTVMTLVVRGTRWVVKLMRRMAPVRVAYCLRVMVPGGCRVTDRLRVLAVWLSVSSDRPWHLVSRCWLTVLLVT